MDLEVPERTVHRATTGRPCPPPAIFFASNSNVIRAQKPKKYKSALYVESRYPESPPPRNCVREQSKKRMPLNSLVYAQSTWIFPKNVHSILVQLLEGTPMPIPTTLNNVMSPMDPTTYHYPSRPIWLFHIGGPFVGCSHTKSPTTWGLYWAPDLWKLP